MNYEERQLLLKLAEQARRELRREQPPLALEEEIGNLALHIATRPYTNEWGSMEVYDFEH